MSKLEQLEHFFPDIGIHDTDNENKPQLAPTTLNDEENGLSEPKIEYAGDTLLHLIGLYDEFLNGSCVTVLFFLNLWMMFITDDTIEIALNAVAMEFIADIDEHIKDAYIGYARTEVICSLIQNKCLDKSYQDGNVLSSLEVGFLLVLNGIHVFILTVSPFCALFFLFYIPICKF